MALTAFSRTIRQILNRVADWEAGRLKVDVQNETLEVELANENPINVSISDEKLPTLTAENETTGDAEDLKATSQGQLLVKNEDAYPFYEQYEIHDLESQDIGEGATGFLAKYAAIGTLSDRVLLVTITGDGTATVGIDVAADLNGSYLPDWHSLLAALGTGLTKVSGLAGNGKVALAFPAGLWARYVRVWVTETGTTNHVTIGAKVGGRP